MSDLVLLYRKPTKDHWDVAWPENMTDAKQEAKELKECYPEAAVYILEERFAAVNKVIFEKL